MGGQRPLHAVAEQVQTQLGRIVDRATPIAGGVALTSDDPQIAYAQKMARVTAVRPFARRITGPIETCFQTVKAPGRHPHQSQRPGAIRAGLGRLPIQVLADGRAGVLVHQACLRRARLGAHPVAGQGHLPPAVRVALENLPVRGARGNDDPELCVGKVSWAVAHDGSFAVVMWVSPPLWSPSLVPIKSI